MKILYFTASGNCLAVAKRFDAELLSIPQMIRAEQYTIEDDVVGIIYPIYGFGLPGIVKRYLEQSKIKADYVFAIGTYGNMDGAASHEMKKLLEKNGNHADYYETLLMVDNYLPGYEIGKQLSMLKEKDTENHLQRIIGEVRRREKKYHDKGLGWNLLSSAMSSAGDGAMKNRARRWFSVSDDCIGCGICAKVCPVSNVVQNGKSKPEFSNHCISCFACTHNCPKKAIHLKNEKSGERFRNPEVSVKEIIEANNQG